MSQASSPGVFVPGSVPSTNVVCSAGHRQANVVGVELGRVLGLHTVLLAEVGHARVHPLGELREHADEPPAEWLFCSGDMSCA